MLTTTQGQFLRMLLLLLVCLVQAVPANPARLDLTSGTLIVGGTIGIVALAASTGLLAMSGLQRSRDCNCKKTKKKTTHKSKKACEAILRAEREMCEKEKEDLELELQDAALELCKTAIAENCEEQLSSDEETIENCIVCSNFFEDEAGCNNLETCSFIDGVCVHDIQYQ